MLVHDLLRRSARLFGEVEAVRDGRERVTFRELERRVDRLADALEQSGLQRGQRVAVVARNRVEYVELYFALASLGAVIVPVNWRLHASEIAYIVADSESVALVADERFLETLEPLRDLCPAVRSWIAFDGSREGWTSFASLHPGAAGADLRDFDERDVAVQMYTSGTTGRPKGAMLTHRNVGAMVLAWLHEIRLEPARSRFLQVTPLFHVGGMLQVMACVAAGAQLRLEPEFLPGPALDALERERITHALFVPAMIQWMLAEKDVEQRRFPDLELVIYGAAPMPLATLGRALEVFRCGFLQGYGLTETAGVVTTLRPEDHVLDDPARLASAGRAVLGCEVRVVDERTRELAPGEIGEIVVRGDNVFAGYWKLAAASAESFRDGWFRTGDVGRMDARGYVTIVDRSKDMILVGGENVYSSEVENALREHGDVSDACVIGIPHEAWGEEVLAVVVLHPGARASDRVLIQHCRGRLARFKCPTRVEVVHEIPRSAAGKALKHALREPYWAGRARRV